MGARAAQGGHDGDLQATALSRWSPPRPGAPPMPVHVPSLPFHCSIAAAPCLAEPPLPPSTPESGTVPAAAKVTADHQTADWPVAPALPGALGEQALFLGPQRHPCPHFLQACGGYPCYLRVSCLKHALD